MSFVSQPLPHEKCSCGAEMFVTATSIEGGEKQRAAFREAHGECRERPAWQACPICSGCGTVPADFYTRFGSATSTAREQCRSCTGTGLIARPSSAGVQLEGEEKRGPNG